MHIVIEEEHRRRACKLLTVQFLIISCYWAGHNLQLLHILSYLYQGESWTAVDQALIYGFYVSSEGDPCTKTWKNTPQLRKEVHQKWVVHHDLSAYGCHAAPKTSAGGVMFWCMPFTRWMDLIYIITLSNCFRALWVPIKSHKVMQCNLSPCAVWHDTIRTVPLQFPRSLSMNQLLSK